MITKKGKTELEKTRCDEDERSLKRKKDKEYFDKYFPYANNHLCPQCGEYRPHDEINVWINGEYGPMYFYIVCSLCGCKETNIKTDKELKRVQEYFGGCEFVKINR